MDTKKFLDLNAIRHVNNDFNGSQKDYLDFVICGIATTKFETGFKGYAQGITKDDLKSNTINYGKYEFNSGGLLPNLIKFYNTLQSEKITLNDLDEIVSNKPLMHYAQEYIIYKECYLKSKEYSSNTWLKAFAFDCFVQHGSAEATIILSSSKANNKDKLKEWISIRKKRHPATSFQERYNFYEKKIEFINKSQKEIIEEILEGKDINVDYTSESDSIINKILSFFEIENNTYGHVKLGILFLSILFTVYQLSQTTQGKYNYHGRIISWTLFIGIIVVLIFLYIKYKEKL